MIICPSCGHENIEGDDACEQCFQPLTGLHLPEPATAIERSLIRDRIGLLSPKEPICVEPTMPVGQVLKLLVERGIGCVIVAEGGKAVGMFSERDALVKLNTSAAELSQQPVSEFMTTPAQTLEGKNKIAFAVQRMSVGSFRHVPIVDHDGQVTGIISVRDILRYLTERMAAASA